ncbi:MAG: protein kinase [Archangium sp.]
MRLVRKVADGAAVEAFLAAEGNEHFVVQLSRASLSEEWLGRLFDRSTDAATSEQHPELLASSNAMQFTKDGRFATFTEPVTGWTARDYLNRVGHVPEALVADWAISVCEALHQLHSRGQVHGCLAPRHLHLFGSTEVPSVKLFDTSLLHLRNGSNSLPVEGCCVVEPEYLSPERATGSRGAQWSDIWGVGALLLELLTGRPPFRGRDADESRALARRSRIPQLPLELAKWRDVLEGCLAPLPTNRFWSVIEVRQALLQAV